MTYGTVIDARNPFKDIHTSRLRRAAIVRLFGIPELLLRDERMQTLTFTSDTFHFRGVPFVAIFHSIKPPPLLSITLSLSLSLSLGESGEQFIIHGQTSLFRRTAFRSVEFLLPSNPLRGLQFCHLPNIMTRSLLFAFHY